MVLQILPKTLQEKILPVGILAVALAQAAEAEVSPVLGYTAQAEAQAAQAVALQGVGAGKAVALRGVRVGKASLALGSLDNLCSLCSRTNNNRALCTRRTLSTPSP